MTACAKLSLTCAQPERRRAGDGSKTQRRLATYKERARVGAVVDQQLDARQTIGRVGAPQRLVERAALKVVEGVDVGAASEQQREHVAVAAAGSNVQRARVVLRRLVDVGAFLLQLLAHLVETALLHCEDKRHLGKGIVWRTLDDG